MPQKSSLCCDFFKRIKLLNFKMNLVRFARCLKKILNAWEKRPKTISDGAITPRIQGDGYEGVVCVGGKCGLDGMC